MIFTIVKSLSKTFGLSAFKYIQVFYECPVIWVAYLILKVYCKVVENRNCM